MSGNSESDSETPPIENVNGSGSEDEGDSTAPSDVNRINGLSIKEFTAVG